MNYANITSLMKVKNKPKQTQLKPKQSQNQFDERAKLMQSVYLQRIMNKNVDMGYEKTKPKQSQSTLGMSAHKPIKNP